MIKAQPRRTNALTLMELIGAILILGVLMAVSLPLYVNAVKDSRKKTCRATLQTISIAVMAAKVRLNYQDYGAFFGSIDTTLETDLYTIPKCPDNGTYTISNGDGNNSFKVSCSVPGHGSYEPNRNIY